MFGMGLQWKGFETPCPDVALQVLSIRILAASPQGKICGSWVGGGRGGVGTGLDDVWLQGSMSTCLAAKRSPRSRKESG